MRTHDYRNRYFGHDYATTSIRKDGHEISAVGWGRGIQDFDYLILRTPDGRGSRYEVQSISYYQEPPDMWQAELKFAPREKETE